MHGISMRENLHRVIREYEVSLAAKYMPKGGRLLEVGAGKCLQAIYLQNIGFEVDAIDVADSIHIGEALFPVQIYDGKTIPFPDETFDLIFSSNVLEHIPWCVDILVEMKRVIKKNGLMVHIVPTTSWRLWTSVAHYYRNLQIMRSLLSSSLAQDSAMTANVAPLTMTKPTSFFRKIRIALMPFRHGVYGNWLTELYYFSTIRWRRTFEQSNLDIVKFEGSGIFYTGYGIPGIKTSIAARIKLAKFFGSSTALFVLRPKQEADHE